MSVVRIRRKGGVVVQDCDIYIGRPQYQGGWSLSGSKWGNPYKLAECPEEVKSLGQEAILRWSLSKYEAYVRASPELMSSLWTLRGKRLGCFCDLVEKYPNPRAGKEVCHGQVLLRLLREQESSASMTQIAEFMADMSVGSGKEIMDI